jgi:hypothetical protein
MTRAAYRRLVLAEFADCPVGPLWVWLYYQAIDDLTTRRTKVGRRHARRLMAKAWRELASLGLRGLLLPGMLLPTPDELKPYAPR